MALIKELLTEQPNQQTTGIDLSTTKDMLTLINEEDKKVACAVEAEIPQIAAAVDIIACRLSKGGRLVYIGAGTSGRLGVLDAAECPPTFSVDPGLVIGLIAGGNEALVQAVEGAEDNESEVVAQLRSVKLDAKDVVVGVAASGRTPYVAAGLKYAAAAGAYRIAISCVNQPLVGRLADLTIAPLVGPEVITGSTRLKAGTATKMVLNMLSTAAMVKLGKVYGNLMVDVKPTNEKLRQRAIMIVAEAAGATADNAGNALEQAGQNAKLAIVMLKCGCGADEGVKLLAEAGGFIRRAIKNGQKGK